MGVLSDNFTAGFFFSSIVTVFVPDIAVAAQLYSPQNGYKSPQWSFLKNISTLRHITRPNGFYNKISIILFFLFHYLFNSICGHNFDRTVARKSSVPSRICLIKKGDAS